MNVGVPHAPRRSIASRLSEVSVDASFDAALVAQKFAERVGLASNDVVRERASVGALAFGDVPLALCISRASGFNHDAVAALFAAKFTPDTLGISVTLILLSRVVTVAADETASGGGVVPAAHLEESLAGTFGVDHGTSFHTSGVEDIPHALGVVEASVLCEVLERAASLAGTDASVDDGVGVPVAERAGDAFVLSGHLLARVLAVVVGIRPDALGIQVTRSGVAVLVRAVPVAEAGRPEAHWVSAAVGVGGQDRAAAVALGAEEVPGAIGIGFALGLRRIHEDALLRTVAVEVDEAHVVRFARSGDEGPAVRAALVVLSRPHAALFGIAGIGSGVSDVTRRSASEFSAVPDASGLVEASRLVEEVDAGEGALLLGLGTPDAHCVGLALRLVGEVVTVAFAKFGVGVPHTFCVGVAHVAVPEVTVLALELAGRRAADLPVAVVGEGSADFAAVDHGALLIAERADGIPHAAAILDAETAESVFTLAAAGALGAGKSGSVPEAHGVGAAFGFGGGTGSGFVGRARLDASGRVTVPAAVRVVGARNSGVTTDVAEAALALALGDVETLPFADGGNQAGTLGLDARAGLGAHVVDEIPGAFGINTAIILILVLVVATKLAATVRSDFAHGVGNANGVGVAFLSADAVALLGTGVDTEIPHAVDVVVTSLRSGVLETAQLAAAHGEVATRERIEVEEGRPGAAVVGLARSDVGKSIALLFADGLRKDPLAHALAHAIVLTVGVRASGDAEGVGIIPRAARIVVAGRLVEPAELAAEFADTGLVVEGAHGAEVAVSLRGDLTARLAADTLVGVPHALAVGAAGAFGGELADGVASSTIPQAEVISGAHFCDVERRDTGDLSITIAAVAAGASKSVPEAGSITIAIELGVVLVLATLLADAQSPLAHGVGVAAELGEEQAAAS